MRRVLPLILIASLLGIPAVGCGDDQKRPTSEDRAAMDRFAAGVRKWRKQGTEPWNAAFTSGPAALQSQGPALEAKMQSAIREIKAGANGVSEPAVRKRLKALAATYSGKLAAISQIDNAGYSMSAIQAGLAGLKKQGAATKRAWEAYVAQVTKTWNENPLSGLNLG